MICGMVEKMNIIWIISYGMIYVVSEKLSEVIGKPYVITTLAVGLYSAILCGWLYKSGKLEYYYVSKIQKWNKRSVILSLPLLSYPVANFIVQGDRVNLQRSVWAFVLIFLMVFLEEFFFRGYLLRIISVKYHIENKWKTAVISSLLFGVFHFVNYFQGADLLFTVLQVIGAFGIGMCFSSLTLYFRSIIPGTTIHLLINATSFNEERKSAIITISFLSLAILHIIYAKILYNKMENPSKGER